MQKISLTPGDSLSDFNDTPTFGANKTPQLQGVTLAPIIHISNSSEDAPALNVNKTHENQNLLTYEKEREREQRFTETENLREEMIALK